MFYGAVVLLVIGLPIMLLTGHHERRRVVARTTGLVAATPATRIGRWLTWRKAILGRAIAFTALAAVVGIHTAMRLLGIGPVGTLVASGVLQDREPLILTDFENRSADSTLGPSLTEAFRVDLSQSPTVRLLDPSAIAEALRRMERQGAGALPISLARSEARGDTKRAAEYYGRLVELWKDADPELQAGVREARSRLGKLSTELGS